LKDEFGASRFLSKSGTTGVLLIQQYYVRTDSDAVALVAFDLEDNNHCRMDIAVTGGPGFDMGTWGSTMGKIRKFIEGFAAQNSLKLKDTDSQLRGSSSELYGPTPESFLKKCIKCGKRIPLASEECKYCGARQPDTKCRWRLVSEVTSAPCKEDRDVGI
jgi:hypothetical protein